MTADGSWLFGGSAGSDYLYELCTGIPKAPEFILSGPKCAVDDAGMSPVVRDPHNWVLNISLYHGLVGLAVFVIALTVPAWKGRKTNSAAMPIAGIATYLVSGSTFLISAGYALLPMTVFVAWLIRNFLESTPVKHIPLERAEAAPSTDA